MLQAKLKSDDLHREQTGADKAPHPRGWSHMQSRGAYIQRRGPGGGCRQGAGLVQDDGVWGPDEPFLVQVLKKIEEESVYVTLAPYPLSIHTGRLQLN